MMPLNRNHHARVPAAFRRPGLRRIMVATLGLCVAAGPTTVALADGPGHVRPMGGRCTTTFVFTAADVVHLDGDCHLLHLGVTKTVSTQSAVQQPDGTLFLTNDIECTSAEGDKLNANFVGVAVFSATGVSFSGTETYRRGTGRLADAIGSSALQGSAQFTSPTEGIGEFRTLGFISF